MCNKVEEDWDDQHNIFFDHKAEAIPSRKSQQGKLTFAPSRCMTFGLCVCRDPRGKQAAVFTNKLIAKFREFFKKGTAGRRQLNANLVVLKLDEVDTETDQVEDDLGKSLFYHLGYCNLKTWVFTLVPLVKDSRPPSKPGAIPLRLPTAAEGVQDTLDHVRLGLHQFARFDLAKGWACQNCTLIRSKGRFADISNMRPEHVEVMVGSGFSQSGPPDQPDPGMSFLWRGWDNEKPKHRGKSSGPQKPKGPGAEPGRNQPSRVGHREAGSAAPLDDGNCEQTDDGDMTDHADADQLSDHNSFEMDSMYTPSLADSDHGGADIFEDPAMQAAADLLEQGECDGLLDTSRTKDADLDAEDVAVDPLPSEATAVDVSRNLDSELQAASGSAAENHQDQIQSELDGAQNDNGDANSVATSDISITPTHSGDSKVCAGFDSSSSSSSSLSTDSDLDDAEAKTRAEAVPDDRFEFGVNGSVRYNHKTKNLVAHCCFHAGNCRRTRTSVEASRLNARNRGQGRPLGHLCAWLAAADAFEDSAAHSRQCHPTLQEKQRARAQFNQQAGAAAFSSSYERNQRPGEPEEPESMT